MSETTVDVAGLPVTLDLEPGDVVTQAVIIVGVERADSTESITVIGASNGMSNITERGLTSFAHDAARGLVEADDE